MCRSSPQVSNARARAGHRYKLTSCIAVNTLHHLYTLLAMTQSRATNIPFSFSSISSTSSWALQELKLVELSIASLLLQFMSFFAFGGSNAISSVDLSSAYNGIADFNVGAVGILTFVSNWAGPILLGVGNQPASLRKRKAGSRASSKNTSQS